MNILDLKIVTLTMMNDKKTFTTLFLPTGWYREETTNIKGLSTGQVRVTYIGPTGKRFFNKAQLIQAVGIQEIPNFDFNTGKLIQSHKKKRLQTMKGDIYF